MTEETKIDFSFETDKETYFNMKKLFVNYEDGNCGTGTLFKGLEKKKECFEIKFMEHVTENFNWYRPSQVTEKPVYWVYIRKVDCDNKK